MDLEYSRFKDGTRDPYLPAEDGNWKDRTALKWNLQLAGLLEWRNNVHTETVRDSGTVRSVGWEWEIAIPISQFELFTHHHSRHVMERESTPGTSFPVEDNWGVRVKLIK